MKEFIAQFEKLLADGKLEDAKKALAGFGSTPVSEDEKLETKIMLTRLYIKLTNALNQDYLKTLEEATAGLKTINASEKKFDEQVALARARASLAAK
jgi:hypothetical protein